MNGTQTNKFSINIIILTLALLALVCVSTICTLAYYGIKIPPELNTLSGGLVGSLGTMLAKTSPTETIKQAAVADSSASGVPTPVEVVNTIATPVPTTETTKI